jgi:hypothetical protein
MPIALPDDDLFTDDQTLKVGSFRDLMGGYESAQIKCLMQRRTVRTLQVKMVGDNEVVEIDPNIPGDRTYHDLMTVSLDTIISYQPWDMDRGSLIFGGYKICTELDTILYPDDVELSIQPKRGGINAG